MRALAFAVGIGVLAMVSPVKAGFWDKLFGPKTFSVDCPPTDRACLFEQTRDLVLSQAAQRDRPTDTANFTARLAELYHLTPAPDQPAFIEVVEDFADHETVMENFNHYMTEKAPRPVIALADLSTALQTRTTPDGSKFGDYILAGFRSATTQHDPQEVMFLFEEHKTLLWKEAARSYRYIQRWLARHSPAQFVEFSRRSHLSGRTRERTWKNLGRIALTHCESGRRDEGAAVLTQLLEQFDLRSPEDIVLKLYARAELFGAITYCFGEEAARTELAEIETAKKPAYAFIRDKYPDANEQAFVLSAAHDTIEVRTTRQLATWLYLVKGDKDAARAVFERGQATVGVWGFEGTDEGQTGLANQGRQVMSFETFESDTIEGQKWHPSAAVALRYLLGDYAFNATNGYATEQDMKSFLQAVEDDWPSTTAQQAAVRLYDMALAIEAADPRRRHLPHWTVLVLAQNTQPQDCKLNDDVLQAILTDVPAFEFNEQRPRILVDYIRYLDRTTQAAPDNIPCILPELMK